MTRSGDRTRLEVAGMVDEESGRLEQPMAADQWRVPLAVELAGEWLAWEWGEGPDGRFVQSARPLLEDFAALADAPADRIRDYARRWGVLYVCEHFKPRSHNPWTTSSAGCLHLRQGIDGGREPLLVWREYARRARAILRSVATLRGEDQLDAKRLTDWFYCFPLEYPAASDYAQPTWLGVALAVNLWLGEAGLMGLRAGAPLAPAPSVILDVGFSPLFGALGLQLLFAATGSSGLAICSNCGGPYFPRSRPRKNQRRYCRRDACRRASRRDAKRDQRQRDRADGNADGNR